MDENVTDKTERHRMGERLRQVRGSTSQGEFSKTFGINQNTISRYERGERSPDIDFVSMICRATGVNPRWLILGEEPMYDAEASQERPRLKAGDWVGKSIKELPAGAQRPVKKAMKGAQAWWQRWEKLPDWAKDHIEELEEELDEARAELLKAKDEAINAQNMALQSMAGKTDTLVDSIMKALEDKGLMYTTDELFEAMKSCSTPAELEKLIKQGRKK